MTFDIAESQWYANEALNDFRQSIATDPSNGLAYLNCGIALAARDKIDAAIKCFSIAIRLKPSDRFAYQNRSELFARTGDYPAAIADVSSAIRIEPKVNSLWLARGKLLLSNNDIAGAITDFEEASRLAPTSTDASLALAKAYGSNDKWPESLREFDRAVQFAPTDVHVIMSAAQIYATCRDESCRKPAAALSLIRYAFENGLLKRNPKELQIIAAVYAANRDFVNAISVINGAITEADEILARDLKDQREAYQGKRLHLSQKIFETRP